jgi:hypothetical protein
MTNRRQFFGVVGLSIVSQICLAQTPTDITSQSTKAWQEFSLPNGQFVVSMPAKPKSQAIPLDSKTIGLVAYILAADLDGESYAVAYVEFPNPIDDAAKSKAVLDGIVEKEVAKVAGRLGQRDIELNGFSGREVTIEVVDGFWVDRLYLVKGRVYFVSAFAAKRQVDAKEINKEQHAIIQKYFESLRLKLNHDVFHR